MLSSLWPRLRRQKETERSKGLVYQLKGKAAGKRAFKKVWVLLHGLNSNKSNSSQFLITYYGLAAIDASCYITYYVCTLIHSTFTAP